MFGHDLSFLEDAKATKAICIGQSLQEYLSINIIKSIKQDEKVKKIETNRRETYCYVETMLMFKNFFYSLSVLIGSSFKYFKFNYNN